MTREKFVYDTQYGETTDIYLLPIGTKFRVSNGVWGGEIVKVNGRKHMHILDTGNITELKENYDYSLVLHSVQYPNE